MSTEALERKKRSETILKKHSVPINQNLPLLETADSVILRPVQNVAERALALSYIILVAFDAVSVDWVLDDLKLFELENIVTSAEKKFLLEPNESRKRIMTWRAESLWTLLWALKVVDDLRFPDGMIHINDLPTNGFPLKSGMDPPDYLRQQHQLRTTGEILDAADFNYRALWACRNELLYTRSNSMINAAIVYERFRSLNWLLCLNNDDWDNVTASTD